MSLDLDTLEVAPPRYRDVAVPVDGANGRLSFTDGDPVLDVTVVRRDEYPIVIERGSLRRTGDLLRPWMDALDAHDAIVVTDENVAGIHLDTVLVSMRAAGVECSEMLIPPGEPSKSVQATLDLWETLRERGCARRTFLVALGGGVLCDLVGFVAATYMRGVPYVNVPTSLMAQIDGAIGGKVGVDHPTAKNLIGAFYHPVGVVIDPDAVLTCDRREICNGLAEACKVAVICSDDLFAVLEAIDPDDLAAGGDGASDDTRRRLGRVAREAIAAKLALLAPDPFETSLRRLLNFGHSIGHALEAASGYRVYRHGEAVSVGMATAAQISSARGLCDEATRARIVGLLSNLRLPTRMPDELWDDVWEHLEIIRRIRNGKLHFVVPLAIGKCDMLDHIDEGEYRAALRSLARAA